MRASQASNTQTGEQKFLKYPPLLRYDTCRNIKPDTYRHTSSVQAVHNDRLRWENMSAADPRVVYLVDDDEDICLSLGSLLRSSGLHVEAFPSLREFLSFPKQAGPSCLVLDVRLRGENGLTFQQEAAKSGLHMPILFITGYADIEMSVRAMKAGAQEFFTKPFRDQDMLDAIAQALTRDAARLAAEQSIAAIRVCYDSLTPREREVMSYVVAGLVNKEIALQMELSEIMVKIHRGRVMKKMASRSIADLVRKADALGVPANPNR